MANAQKGEYSIRVGERLYTLVMNTNAMAEVEALFSTPLQTTTFEQVLRHVNAGSIRHVRGFIWGALREYHGDVTLAQAGEIIDIVGLVGLSEQLQAVARATQPDPADVAELGLKPPNPQPARVRKKHGTGANFKSMRDARALHATNSGG